MSAPEEHHEFKFNGVWLPPAICHLVAQGKLRSKALALYIIIQALQGEEGCYASNQYLAQQCGLSQGRDVRKYITKLKEMGLVEQVGFNGRRRWLRVVVPGVQGALGPDRCETHRLDRCETHRSDRREMHRHNNAKGNSTKHKHTGGPTYGRDACGGEDSNGGNQGQPQAARTATKAPGGPHAGLPPENATAAGCGPAASGTTTTNSSGGFGLATPSGPQPTAADLAFATKLRDAVRARYGKDRRVNTTKWAQAFRLLREQDGVQEEQVGSVLGWLLANMGGRYTPRVASAQQFRAKWPQLLDGYLAHQNTAAGVVVTEKVQEAAQRMLRYHNWPPNWAKELPALYQLALDRYQARRKVLEERRDKYEARYQAGDGHAKRHAIRAQYLLDTEQEHHPSYQLERLGQEVDAGMHRQVKNLESLLWEFQDEDN